MDSVDCGKKASAPLPPPTYSASGSDNRSYPMATLPPPLGGGAPAPQQPPYGQQQPVMGQIVPQSQPQQCTMTMELLERHLRDSNYGADRAHYLSYFLEGLPPRCLACGQPVGMHKEKKKKNKKERKKASCDNHQNDTPPAFQQYRCDDSEDSGAQRSRSNPSTYSESDDDDTASSSFSSSSSTSSMPPAATSSFLSPPAPKRSTTPTRSTHHAEEGTPTTTTRQSYPKPTCWECQSLLVECGREIDSDEDELLTQVNYKKVLSWKWEAGAEELDACQSSKMIVRPPSCDECGITAKLGYEKMKGQFKEDFDEFWAKNKDLQFYQCGRCYKRTVCSNCVSRGFHTKERSRYNFGPNPEWQTSLLGCCGSPRHVLSYMCCAGIHPVGCGNPPLFNRSSLQEVIGQSCELYSSLFGFGPVWIIMHMMALASEIFCVSSCLAFQRDVFMHRRFGLPVHSMAEYLFCRHCILIRSVREAEARGYPQPVFWTTYKDIDDMVASYPPHPLMTTDVDGEKYKSNHHTSPLSMVAAPQPASLV